MPARVGKAPWYQGVSETTKTGRQRATLSSGNQEWDLTEGWHAKRKRGWKGRGQKSGLVQKVQRTTPDGKTVTVYKTTGYDDTIGFHSHDEPDEDALSYALNAFDKNDPSHGPIFEQDGCGHIAKLEYAQVQQVLRVTFTNNGAICLFYRVPTAVAGELLALAQKKTTQYSAVDGTERHTLGIVFWDLVRIRGQRHGARYPFEYESRGRYKLTGSGKRYSVVLSDENIKKVLGGRYYGRELKPGETVTAILSEEEYAKWQEEVHGQAALGERRVSVNDKDTGESTVEVGGVEADMYDNHAASQAGGPGLEEILGAKDFARYMELSQRMAHAQSEAQQNREAELQGKHIDLSEDAKKDIWRKAYARALTDPELQGKNGKPSIQKLTDYVMSQMDKMSTGTNEDYADKRFKTYHMKASANPARVTVTPHQVFAGDKTALNDYLRLSAVIRKADNPTKYAATYVGRPWTVSELISFANPTVPGAISVEHAPLYKRLVQMNDYEAALNFLKNHKHNIYSNEKVIARRPYASQYDFVVMDGGDK